MNIYANAYICIYILFIYVCIYPYIHIYSMCVCVCTHVHVLLCASDWVCTCVQWPELKVGCSFIICHHIFWISVSHWSFSSQMGCMGKLLGLTVCSSTEFWKSKHRVLCSTASICWLRHVLAPEENSF